MRLLVLAALLAGCHAVDWLQYRWDDRGVVCSQSFDDLSHDLAWDDITRQLDLASYYQSVTFVHAHNPTVTVSRETIENVLAAIDRRKLAYVTFPELASGPARPGVAISFDDQWIENWFAVRDLLAAHGARVTFFVTRLHLWSPEQLAMLRTLAADGHAIEAHSKNHLDAAAFVAEHGAQRYLDEEALPSLAKLRELGFEPTAYAYPFGSADDDVNRALLREVTRVRVGIGSCPH